MKNKSVRSIAAIAVMAWSLGEVLAQESEKTDKPEAAKEDRERDSSGKDRRARIMRAFDRNKDGDLDQEERGVLRRYIESRSSKSGGEKTRDDKIEVPKDYDPKKKYPFILSLHGYGSSSRGQLRFFPLEDLAEKHDFIYCAPDAVDRSWNATEACCDWRGKVDDSTYLRALIESAVRKYSIDRSRIYVTGLSNGGFMSYRMAHDHSDLIAAIVPLLGWATKPGQANRKDQSACCISTAPRTVRSNGTEAQPGARAPPIRVQRKISIIGNGSTNATVKWI